MHSSGICACTYHLFYNQASVSFLVALQAFLTTFGNTTVAYATYRLAASNGWTRADLPTKVLGVQVPPMLRGDGGGEGEGEGEGAVEGGGSGGSEDGGLSAAAAAMASQPPPSSSSSSSSPLVGFEDLANLSEDTDFTFLGKVRCGWCGWCSWCSWCSWCGWCVHGRAGRLFSSVSLALFPAPSLPLISRSSSSPSSHHTHPT